MLSHSGVEGAKDMNAQARVCACLLRQHFSLDCETLLPQVIQRNGIGWWPYIQAVLVPSVPKPPATYVLVAYGPTSHPPDPITDTWICLDRCLQRGQEHYISHLHQRGPL